MYYTFSETNKAINQTKLVSKFNKDEICNPIKNCEECVSKTKCNWCSKGIGFCLKTTNTTCKPTQLILSKNFCDNSGGGISPAIPVTVSILIVLFCCLFGLCALICLFSLTNKNNNKSTNSLWGGNNENNEKNSNLNAKNKESRYASQRPATKPSPQHNIPANFSDSNIASQDVASVPSGQSAANSV
eukprot:gb/GECH01004154.1/.p1 GENE.gb/GECH01004154.1/~~gb/GECH01004154.1/.p1  ORF type:complete len:187 (+),score=25.18 gb/GECH01004154.1/:1-561(+)